MRKIIIVFFVLMTSSFLVASQENDDVVLLPASPLISEVTWSPDGTKLAVYEASEIHIFDTDTWNHITTIHATTRVSWHPNSQLIAGTGGGTSEQLLIWDANTGSLVREWVRSDPRIRSDSIWSQPNAIAWHPDGKIITTSAFLGHDEILFWDMSEERDYNNPIVMKTDSEIWHHRFDLEWNQSGDMFFSSGTDELPLDSQYTTISTNYVLDTNSRETILTLQKSSIDTWGPDNTLIGIRWIDDVIQIAVWDIETGAVLNHFDKHAANITSIDFNEHSSVVASVDIDGTLLIWNFTTSNNDKIEPVESTFLKDVAWKPNSDILAIAGEGGVVIRHYDLSS